MNILNMKTYCLLIKVEWQIKVNFTYFTLEKTLEKKQGRKT